MRVSFLVRSLTVPLAATAIVAGCSAPLSTSPTMPGTAQRTPSQIPLSEHALPNQTVALGIRLEGEKAKTSKKYGKVLGYFVGTTSTKSQVITLSPSEDVTFTNVDTIEHTASFLGDATKKSAPWPSSFDGSHTQSPAGTDIGTTNFSTGELAGGKTSLVYNSGAPGFYMFGCFFHYNSSGMRTVIIVK